MKKTSLICAIIIANLFLFNLFSQDIKKRKYTTVTTPRGDMSLMPTPSDSSERIKYEYQIEKDSIFFIIKADTYEKGVLIDSMSDAIISKIKLVKGNQVLFEMVPDISKPQIMTLFSYFPGAIFLRYLFCNQNRQVKYKKFVFVDPLKNNHIPMILGYVDDELNNTEKILGKYVKNNLITITSKEELHEKILNKIEKCLFIYQELSNN